MDRGLPSLEHLFFKQHRHATSKKVAKRDSDLLCFAGSNSCRSRDGVRIVDPDVIRDNGRTVGVGKGQPVVHVVYGDEGKVICPVLLDSISTGNGHGLGAPLVSGAGREKTDASF